MIRRFNCGTNSVIFYVGKAEADDPEVRAFLKRAFKRCRQTKIRPVVMYSGGGELADLTGALLVSNRKSMAAREAEAERAAQQGERQSVLALLDQSVPRKTSRPRLSRQHDMSR